VSDERVFTVTQRYRITTKLSDDTILAAGRAYALATDPEIVLETVQEVLETAVEMHHVGDSFYGIEVEMHSSQLEESDPGFF
jgi:SRSO17 transposase